jgi:ribosomal protein L6P/L9E
VRGVLYPVREIRLRGQISTAKSQLLIVSQSVSQSVSQLAASIQDRRDPRTAPRQDIRGSELIAKERL